EYRNGSFESAQKTLANIPAQFPNSADAWVIEVPRKTILAMTLFRTAHQEESRNLLTCAVEQYRQQAAPLYASPGEGWEGLFGRALLIEAHQLIRGSSMEDLPFHLLRVHVYGELGEKE